MLKQAISIMIFLCICIIAASVGVLAYILIGITQREALLVSTAILACLFSLQIFMTLNHRLMILENIISKAEQNFTLLNTKVTKLAAHSDASDEGIRNQFQEKLGNTKADIAMLTGITRKLAERTARLESKSQQAGFSMNNSPSHQTTDTKHRSVQSEKPKIENDTMVTAKNSEPTTAMEDNPFYALHEKVSNDLNKTDKNNQFEQLANEYRSSRNEAEEKDKEYMQALMRNAIRSNELEIFLQPSVALPTRKAENYEMLVRFREPAGNIISASKCIAFATENDILPEIDLKILQYAMVMGERLRERKSKTILFANVSNEMLADAKRFPKAFNILRTNQHLNTGLILEIKQSQWADFGPLEHESLAALSELGYKFCLDFTLDRNLHAHTLSNIGFVYIKMPIKILTSPEGISDMDIHPRDLAIHLKRQGLTLISTDIETEDQARSAIEFGVRHAQGHLFAPAKPVRSDLVRPEIKIGLNELTKLKA